MNRLWYARVPLIAISLAALLAACRPAPVPTTSTSSFGVKAAQGAPRPPMPGPTETQPTAEPTVASADGMQIIAFDSNGDLVEGWHWLRDEMLAQYAQWKLVNIPPGEEDILISVNALATDRADGGRGFDAHFALSLGRERQAGLEVTLPNVSEPRETPGYACHGAVTIPRAALQGATEILITARRPSAQDHHVAFKPDSFYNPRLKAAGCGVQVTDFRSSGDLIQGWYWLRDEGLKQTAQWTLTNIPQDTTDLVLDLEALATDRADGAGGFDAHFVLSFGDDAQYTMPVALANVSPAGDPVGYTCRGTVTIPREALGGGSELFLIVGRGSAEDVHVAFNQSSISRVRTVCPSSDCAGGEAGQEPSSGQRASSGAAAAPPPQAPAPPGYYLAIDPPADADKEGVQGGGSAAPDDNSCWLATAANMLACAGYGDGDAIQDRTATIYEQMIVQFGSRSRGWTDTAVTWWLGSSHNRWAGLNPYTLVTVYGNKYPAYPWADPNGAQFIANGLRQKLCVGLSLSWPTAEAESTGGKPGKGEKVGSGGHAVTAWGDEVAGGSPLQDNPKSVAVTDSDRDVGGDVQVYDYDRYTAPNPEGANEGFGWYISYNRNHPYLKNVVTLAPTDSPGADFMTLRATGSYRVRQARSDGANMLALEATTDADILAYALAIDREPAQGPFISEPPVRSLSAKWDTSENPVRQGQWVEVTAELVLPKWNGMGVQWVRFYYPDGSEAEAAPPLQWRFDTPSIETPEAIPGVTGGYVVGAFDILNSSGELVAQYRLQHQYAFSQSPELHTFTLLGSGDYVVGNLCFGHSYGYLRPSELWQFGEWLTQLPQTYHLGEEATINLDWKGKLPYPPGEDITERVEDLKGAPEQ